MPDTPKAKVEEKTVKKDGVEVAHDKKAEVKAEHVHTKQCDHKDEKGEKQTIKSELKK
ncbi:hypothetical protein RvY_03900 [Ramazzottius varieornatus]|uniref:Uncharacterized protein n=1 Tax=Ramazzottius varieornatus TaxID=947166 RepID=A0A1D1UQG6_RAMVA|nr:hypothetical protein RvY_03900 [Ramazzottius varieornatus]